MLASVARVLGRLMGLLHRAALRLLLSDQSLQLGTARRRLVPRVLSLAATDLVLHLRLEARDDLRFGRVLAVHLGVLAQLALPLVGDLVGEGVREVALLLELTADLALLHTLEDGRLRRLAHPLPRLHARIVRAHRRGRAVARAIPIACAAASRALARVVERSSVERRQPGAADADADERPVASPRVEPRRLLARRASRRRRRLRRAPLLSRLLEQVLAGAAGARSGAPFRASRSKGQKVSSA